MAGKFAPTRVAAALALPGPIPIGRCTRSPSSPDAALGAAGSGGYIPAPNKMESLMGARLMNARKKKKRLAHREARAKAAGAVSEAQPSKPKAKAKAKGR